MVAKQISKLARTSKIPEAKDLQYKILRNTCITNNKLFKWKIIDSPMCSLCKYPSQNSTADSTVAPEYNQFGTFCLR